MCHQIRCGHWNLNQELRMTGSVENLTNSFCMDTPKERYI